MTETSRKPRPLATETARWLLIAAVTIIGAVWLRHRGPEPIIRVTMPLKETAPFWYMLLPFPVFGMLVADFFALLTDRSSLFPAVELGIQLAVLVAISSLRLSFALPVSGHALLFSYFMLRRILVGVPIHGTSGAELAIAAALLGITVYWKLVLWDDPVTLSAGLAIGLALAVGSRLLVREHSSQ